MISSMEFERTGYMGSKSFFSCPECGYTATVSGGYDFGFFAECVTIHCKTCKEIMDAYFDRNKVFKGDCK